MSERNTCHPNIPRGQKKYRIFFCEGIKFCEGVFCPCGAHVTLGGGSGEVILKHLMG